MFKSLRAGSFAIAATSVLFSSAAFAADHSVLIVDGAYFPEIVHVQPGDNVYFRNNSSAAHTVNGADDAWTTGQIGIDGDFMLKVEEDTVLNFSGEGAGGEAMVGEMTFEAPPVVE